MLYKLGKIIVLILFRLLFRIQVFGREHIPKTGPVIICSNHISNLDPPTGWDYISKGNLFYG